MVLTLVRINNNSAVCVSMCLSDVCSKTRLYGIYYCPTSNNNYYYYAIQGHVLVNRIH